MSDFGGRKTGRILGSSSRVVMCVLQHHWTHATWHIDMMVSWPHQDRKNVPIHGLESRPAICSTILSRSVQHLYSGAPNKFRNYNARKHGRESQTCPAYSHNTQAG